MNIQCFLVEEAGKIRRYLRRYHDHECNAPWGPFRNMVEFDVIERPARTMITLDAKGDSLVSRDDPRWPKACECGHQFTEAGRWQIFTDTIYRRVDTGEECSIRVKVPGMMWDAWWMPDCYKGADGRCLVVVCPGGHEWMIDSVASNCTMRDDRNHRCWIRHGEPPSLTVDKNIDPASNPSAATTCAAGAGSIQTPNYHGFLRGGVFVQ
jgi:hypothetical protein